MFLLKIEILLTMILMESVWSAGTIQAQDANSLSDVEKAAGWRLLFDGKSTDGWRGFKSQKVPDSWRVENGSLLSRREPGRSTGDLVTMDQFADFELVFQWKMTKGNRWYGVYDEIIESIDARRAADGNIPVQARSASE